MKTRYTQILVGVTLVTLTACKEPDATPPPETQSAASKTATDNPASGDMELVTDDQILSYLVARDFASEKKMQGFNLDADAVRLGVLHKQTDVQPPIELKKLTALYKQKKKMIDDYEAQRKTLGEQNIKAGQAYLEGLDGQEGVKITDSGLRYKIVTEGHGPSPTLDNVVRVHYRGTSVDGSEFDSSYSRGEPAEFLLNGLIKGWQQALPMMKVGGKWMIYLPSELAYGEKGSGDVIGPNEVLTFEVELIDIVE